MMKRGLSVLVLAGLSLALFGCGMIADKDRIRVAKIGDRYITRGELFKVLREMADDERPVVRNKGDLLRVLNQYVDDQVKAPLVAEVEAELNKDADPKGPPRQLVPREQAMQAFFQQHTEDNYATMYTITDPKAAGMTQLQLDVMKQQMDLEIDRILDKMKADAAVVYLAANAYKKKELTIEDAEFEQEYSFRKDTLKTLEWVKFRAIRFPADMPDSENQAADVRRRLDAGEMFETVQQDIANKRPGSVIESEIENNPTLAKFRGFWQSVSGAEKGAVIGPVFLPEYQIMVEVQGRRGGKNMPAAYLVLQVLDRKEERALTLEEAKPTLAPPLLVGKMMQMLREKNGVEIYEDKLPDPGMFTDRLGGSTVPM